MEASWGGISAWEAASQELDMLPVDSALAPLKLRDRVRWEGHSQAREAAQPGAHPSPDICPSGAPGFSEPPPMNK